MVAVMAPRAQQHDKSRLRQQKEIKFNFRN